MVDQELLNQVNRGVERLNEFVNKDAPRLVINTEIQLLINKLTDLLVDKKD